MVNILESYAYNNGLKNINPQIKILFAFITLIVSLIAVSPVVPLIIAFFIFLLLFFEAKIPISVYLKFMSIPLLFGVFNIIFMTLFFGISEPWVNLGFLNLIAYKDGFNLGLLVFSRMIGCVSCMAFLILTTPVSELLFLAESFKVPKIVTEISLLMYRYIFVFLEEARTMYHAQETRCGYSGIKKSLKSLGLLISNLFIRSWTRGDAIYLSMQSRGYNGSIKVFHTNNKLGFKPILMILFFESLLLLGVYLTREFQLI
ncbi:MAG: cobalt ECF transporter T component CbiQ [Methanobacteriaceae archaeon]|nr:cobalt ECF transporter T component CbiQ [Methanobacteriaceae archaeon]